ncbi:HNH endonuclease [Mycolicibacterium peregrinum]|uniref:HNH endonuclease n=1 Tax=Mycolicibacterium peregrinum TaxID=43304 RepID=UPI0006D76430|nr:DUF222 domain-containing protein [Mycolicibacterium peregrinum]MCV7206801.1 HNH endonuclease [Mycolicibacterium peregrinum]ORW55464.1 HNH endonuclease [Mycolicibacterium peregrinum]OWL96250.1 HNH endonuclease [Mycolicibacterium peregrinum]
MECTFESIVKVDPTAGEAALRDRIAELERLKCAAAAGQARATVALESARHAAEAATRVPVTRRGHGLGSEIGLARMDSPANGRQHLSDARILVHDLPHTLAALECGVLTEARARLIVREAACLSPTDRRRLDHELCADHTGLIGRGDTRIRNDAKTIAYQLDPAAVIDRATRAPQDRHVTFRPAADNMAILTALLTATDAASVAYALTQAADRCTDGRSRGQTMADTLVSRVTGRDTTTPIPVAVNLVLSDDTLFAGSTQPAHLQGHGPIPAAAARRMIGDALADKKSWATLRRLYAAPGTGALVAMESRSRRFPKGLARFIATRDQTCRTPYCDAPIRHVDHVKPHHRNGPTSAANGQGLCEHCNYAKEAPGWQVISGTDEAGRHTTDHITPTGATYRSTAPPLAGGLRILTREIHVVINKRAA